MIALLLCGQVPLTAEGFLATQPAQELAYALSRTGRKAIAAADPAEPGSFIAALRVDDNLLVVRARHPNAKALANRIDSGEFFAVYLALRGTPTPSGKLFVIDAGADGLLNSLPDGRHIDIVREDNSRETRFDGAFAAQRLSAAEYDARLATANRNYARLLNVLIDKTSAHEK